MGPWRFFNWDGADFISNLYFEDGMLEPGSFAMFVPLSLFLRPRKG